jgi:hypothetical protein
MCFALYGTATGCGGGSRLKPIAKQATGFRTATALSSQ